MLREFMKNAPVKFEMTLNDFKATLNEEIVAMIFEKTQIDISASNADFYSPEIGKIVGAMSDIYKKVSANTKLPPQYKIFVMNFVMARMFELWQNSSNAELFFIKFSEKFNPAQIVAALNDYTGELSKYNWALNFFVNHKKIFPQKNRKIRTIGVYYTRIFSGGVERVLSLLIPIYIQQGYRVILFTDLSYPEMEYPLPPPYDLNFKHIIFKTSRTQMLDRLNELSKYLKKYEIDLFISHMPTPDFSPMVQFLFLKLSGVKVIFEMHGSLKFFTFQLPHILQFRLADALINLSRARTEFLRNLGINAHYIPDPIFVEGAENFNGRDPKKVSNIILWVGRIDVDKNPLVVVPIMQEVVKKIPDAKLKILGSADNARIYEHLKNLIQLNNLENNIEFCGYHKNVRAFYESADVMLNTSPHEGWSLVIAESKFYELPSVIYELPDNELTRDGRGYIGVAQGDSHAAAQAIIKILTDTKLRCDLSAQARASLQPFLNYDIGGAWQKIFTDLENNAPVPSHKEENEQIQMFLLEEIFSLTQKVINLTAKIENTKTR